MNQFRSYTRGVGALCVCILSAGCGHGAVLVGQWRGSVGGAPIVQVFRPDGTQTTTVRTARFTRASSGTYTVTGDGRLRQTLTGATFNGRPRPFERRPMATAFRLRGDSLTLTMPDGEPPLHLTRVQAGSDKG